MQAGAFNGAGNRWAKGFSARPGRQAEKYHGKMSNQRFPFSISQPCSFLAPGKWPWAWLEWPPPNPKASPTGQGCSGWIQTLPALQTKELFSFSVKEPNEKCSDFSRFLELFFPFLLRSDKRRKTKKRSEEVKGKMQGRGERMEEKPF